METTEYKSKNIEIVKLEKKKGVFTTEDGNKIPFKTHYVYIKHKDNPLVFKAKIDKVLGDYFDDLVQDAEPVAVSDNGSGFWE